MSDTFHNMFQDMSRAFIHAPGNCVEYVVLPIRKNISYLPWVSYMCSSRPFAHCPGIPYINIYIFIYLFIHIYIYIHVEIEVFPGLIPYITDVGWGFTVEEGEAQL